MTTSETLFSMPSEDDRLARLGLSLLVEPGDPRVSGLVDLHGAQAVWDGLRRDKAISAAGGRRDPARALEQAAKAGIRYVVPGDEEWPDGLADLGVTDPVNGLGGTPWGLWLRGPLHLARATARSVAIVGSRSATTYGARVAADLAASLAEPLPGSSDTAYTVVSGGAFGIDVAAHRGALGAGGTTVAVLACGVNRVYPTAHRELLEHLGAHALVVSELAPGSSPARFRFLARNRLIAALTAGTVVVEAAVRSGALSTGNWASGLNRPLMGVPGPLTSAVSEGVHELLRTGAASLVTHADHVREVLAPVGSQLVERRRAEPTARDLLSAPQRRVLDAVPLHQPAPAASIASVAGLSVPVTRTVLTELAKSGWVEGDGTRWRQRAR